jgi:hypothetical protein
LAFFVSYLGEAWERLFIGVVLGADLQPLLRDLARRYDNDNLATISTGFSTMIQSTKGFLRVRRLGIFPNDCAMTRILKRLLLFPVKAFPNLFGNRNDSKNNKNKNHKKLLQQSQSSQQTNDDAMLSALLERKKEVLKKSGTTLSNCPKASGNCRGAYSG